MPPFPGIPYGPAPYFCFPLTEICMYILFFLCLFHAMKRGSSHVSYLFGGVLFGLLLEYVNVISNMGYVYGKFMIMFGTAPKDIPLCIGVGWGVIMYSARLLTDRLGLSLWASVALDAILAINIDLSMDTVAYRLHMWHWNWAGTGRDPLIADWFGVPFGNFFGWLLVVFFYSSFSRLLERSFSKNEKWATGKTILTPVLSILLSQVALYVMLVYVDKFLASAFGITSKHRFISFLLILIVMVIVGMRKRKKVQPMSALPIVSWLVSLWFHVYFLSWLFIAGFYHETPWLGIAAVSNFLIGLLLHFAILKTKSRVTPITG